MPNVKSAGVFGLFLVAAAFSASASEVGPAVPADLLSLDGWKLTLPLDIDGKPGADELQGEALRRASLPGTFFLADDRGSVVFRALCGGAVTKGSSYPRCELREMSDGKGAAWDVGSDVVRTMELTLAVTALPKVKPHVVCAQIHDAKRDILMVRLEGRKLLVEREGEDDVVLQQDYALGTFVRIGVRAGRGRVSVRYQGRQALDFPSDAKGCYFKAGCYVQSNPRRGDDPLTQAEVRIRTLSVN